MGLNAQMIAAAVVAAAKSYGDDPARALSAGKGSARRALPAACSALNRVTGASLRQICTPLGMPATSVSRARAQGGAAFKAAEAAAIAVLGGAAPPAPAPEPEPAPPAAASSPSAEPDRPETVFTREHHAAIHETSRELQAAHARVGELRSPRPHRTARPRRREAKVVRLGPVTARKLRFARRFINAAWDVEDVAWLFDVAPDALARALGRPELVQ